MTATGIDTLKIGQNFEQAYLGQYGAIYFDNSRDLNLEKISSLSDQEFLPMKETGTNFLPQKQVHWIKFYLKNETSSRQELMLEVRNPHLNRLQVFSLNEKEVVDSSLLIGDNFPFAKRNIHHRNFLFPIEIEPFQSQTYLVFAGKYDEVIRLRFTLSNRKLFEAKDQKESLFLSLSIGFFIGFCLLILIGSMIFRQRILAFFAAYCFSISFVFMASLGVGFQFLWPNSPEFNNVSNYFFPIFATFTLIALTRNFLNTKKTLPKEDRILKIIEYLCIAFLFYLPFHHISTEPIRLYTHRFAIILQIIYPILIILVSILSYKKYGNKNALIFLTGFFFVLFGNFIRIAENFRLIETEGRTEFAILLGFLVDLVLLVIIIGDQIRSTYTENFKLSNKINKLQLEAAAALLEGQQQERQRLSMELHDGISLRLATLKMRLSNLLTKIKTAQSSQEAELLVSEIGRVSENVRNFTHALSPLDLKEQTFQEALEDLIYAIKKANENLDIVLEMDSYDGNKLSNIQSHVLFQTIQELLNNILKHSAASLVKIVLEEENDQLKLRLTDNGKGFDIETQKGGIGLTNIQLRATFLNGIFKVKSSKKGSKFEFSFPLEISN